MILTKFAKYFEGAAFDAKAERWQYVETNFNTISMYLRPIVLAVDFEWNLLTSDNEWHICVIITFLHS